jgi:hypothetical protein
MPRGVERFQAYLRTLVDHDTGDLALPLVTMNPMGKDHLPVLLDTLLAFDAEAVARAAVTRRRAHRDRDRDSPSSARAKTRSRRHIGRDAGPGRHGHGRGGLFESDSRP